ncbi:MAG TPA: Ig-like domain-containing protein, partial [Anaeromyxobacteraceae bacterium]
MQSFIARPGHPSAQRSRSNRLGIALLALAVLACGGNDSSSQSPALSSTFPSDVATGVPLNAKLSATFDMAMAPLGAATFTLKQGTTPVSGTIASSADGTAATFAPSSNLASSTLFTATITTGAKSAAGAAFAAERSWTFTTGTTTDTAAPEVSATNPAAAGTGVAVNTKITASFSKAMDPLSITPASFTVKQGSTPVPGSVAYGPGTTATFTPASALAVNTVFTATLSAAVEDLSGNPLASAFAWSFTTGATAAKGPSPVGLGTAGNYAVLAKTAISTVPAS